VREEDKNKKALNDQGFFFGSGAIRHPTENLGSARGWINKPDVLSVS
jgi:hypothetical protein